MSWRSFLYYTEREKIGVIFLLLMVVLLLSLTVYLRTTKADSFVALQPNDSLQQAFLVYQQQLDSQQQAYYQQRYASRVQSGQTRATDTVKKSPSPFSMQERLPLASHSQGGYSQREGNNKLIAGETIPLNSVDTSLWKRIPQIGSKRAKSIVAYGLRLGGFHSVEQLAEVYSITPEVLAHIRPFVYEDDNYQLLHLNELSLEQLQKHPYITFKQARAIIDYRHRRGKITSLEALLMRPEFDTLRSTYLIPYLSFR